MAQSLKKKRLLGLTADTGGGANRWAPYPAPAGYYWDFVTEDGSIVTQDNEPAVELMKRAA